MTIYGLSGLVHIISCNHYTLDDVFSKDPLEEHFEMVSCPCRVDARILLTSSLVPYHDLQVPLQQLYQPPEVSLLQTLWLLVLVKMLVLLLWFVNH